MYGVASENRGRRTDRPDWAKDWAPEWGHRSWDPDAMEAMTQEIVDRVTDKLNAQAEKMRATAAMVSEIAAKMSEKAQHNAQRHAERMDRLADHLDALDLWTRHSPGARRPRFTRDDIAATAIRIADDEGFDAVSMRRIATELGAGTMTLYHYVRTKDELFTLVNDAVMGEMVIGDDEVLPEDWRLAITMIATRSRDVLRRHPWLLDIHDDPPIGPNALRHFDQSLHAVASLNVDFVTKLDIVTAIDEYVFGFCVHERTHLQDGGDAGPHMARYIEELVATGDYPHLEALLRNRSVEDILREVNEHSNGEDRFARNLRRLLDGFDRELS
jgi:AcrR family transcriptional regulator